MRGGYEGLGDQVSYKASGLRLYYLCMRGGYGGPGDQVSYFLYPEAVLTVYERWV